MKEVVIMFWNVHKNFSSKMPVRRCKNDSWSMLMCKYLIFLVFLEICLDKLPCRTVILVKGKKFSVLLSDSISMSEQTLLKILGFFIMIKILFASCYLIYRGNNIKICEDCKIIKICKIKFWEHAGCYHLSVNVLN